MIEAENNPAIQQLLEQGRTRASAPLEGRELRAHLLVAGAFLLAAMSIAVLCPWPRPLSLGDAVLLVLAFAVVSRVEFDAGAGYTTPIQLIFIPMLFVAPTPLVPMLVALGFLFARLPDLLRGRAHPRRAVLALCSAWFAVAPALVLSAAGATSPDVADWPVYVLALGSMFVVDIGFGMLTDRLAFGVPPTLQLRLVGWIAMVDALLTPIGLVTAFAAVGHPAMVLLTLPLAAVLWIFALERRARIEHALELSAAYQGTALLLGDVVDADDAYTGSHSRGVVALSLAVADELGLDAVRRRNVEFGALLHDIGKIKIPNEIINKPGPLDAEERRLMDEHTIIGQRLLERIGGVLTDAGLVVRASHEHYDGSGYPDGVAGEAIPIEARIVTCCDSFSAMTTSRSYRAALPLADAVAELRRCAGSQFDPNVVAALIAVTGREAGVGGPEPALVAPDPAEVSARALAPTRG